LKIVHHESVQYCARELLRCDEDRWLGAHYAEGKLRAQLFALYALRHEIGRVPAQVSEPPLGEIRLQWWREGLAETAAGRARAHPVLEALRDSAFPLARNLAAIEAAIDARARLFYGEPFGTADELAAWLESAEGGFAAVAARLAGADEKAATAAARAESAYALARSGGALAPSLAAAIGPRALALLGEAAPGLAGLPDAALPGLLHLALTRRYLARPAPISPFGKRLRMFRAMAGGRLLERIPKSGNRFSDEMRDKTKI
jgi:phytoene synthase